MSQKKNLDELLVGTPVVFDSETENHSFYGCIIEKLDDEKYLVRLDNYHPNVIIKREFLSKLE